MQTGVPLTPPQQSGAELTNRLSRITDSLQRDRVPRGKVLNYKRMAYSPAQVELVAPTLIALSSCIQSGLVFRARPRLPRPWTQAA